MPIVCSYRPHSKKQLDAPFPASYNSKAAEGLDFTIYPFAEGKLDIQLPKGLNQCTQRMQEKKVIRAGSERNLCMQRSGSTN